METLAKNLKFLRIKSGKKQAEMQASIGIKRTTWVNYENDISQPYVKELMRIADFFQVSESDLLHIDLSEPGNLFQEPESVYITKKGKLKGNQTSNLTAQKGTLEAPGKEVIVIKNLPNNTIKYAAKFLKGQSSQKSLPVRTKADLIALFSAFIDKVFDLDE